MNIPLQQAARKATNNGLRMENGTVLLKKKKSNQVILEEKKELILRLKLERATNEDPLSWTGHGCKNLGTEAVPLPLKGSLVCSSVQLGIPALP